MNLNLKNKFIAIPHSLGYRKLITTLKNNVIEKLEQKNKYDNKNIVDIIFE